MSKVNIEQIHTNMSLLIERYINIIKKEYENYIPEGRLRQLEKIKDYKEIIFISDFGSINGMATFNNVMLPLGAEKVLEQLKRVPGYGSNKNHQLVDKENLINNNNTFGTYVKHVFLTGTDLEGYFTDLLLHETMHFCGSGGASALKEGMNEYLTRKVAYKYDLHTTGCGYPKEVAIISKLEEIMGEEVINQLAFINDEKEIIRYLEENVSYDMSLLYKIISKEMQEEFDEKYYRYMQHYNGMLGLINKVKNYEKIDYTRVYELIDQYKKSVVKGR